jgi:PAS domain S-box-containing protein
MGIFDLVQNIAKLGVWDWNIRTNELHWSDQIYKIFDLPKDEFGASYPAFLAAVHPEDRHRVQTAVNDSIGPERKPYQIEHRVIHRNGQIIWVLETGHVFFDDNQDAVRMIGVVQDISVNKERERLLQEHERRLHHQTRLSTLGEMAGGISHEIANPVTNIQSILGLLKRKLLNGQSLSPDEILADIAKMDEQVTLAGNIITSMKRLVSDTSEERFKPTRLDDIIALALASTDGKIKSSGITLAIDNPLAGRTLVVKEIQIAQVLMNLLQNAYHAVDQQTSQNAKRIDIKVSETNHYLEIAVEDSAEFIDPNIIDKIMDPFFTTKPLDVGTGLGLSISARIMTEHGGSLRYQTEPRKAFVMQIPNAPANEERAKD